MRLSPAAVRAACDGSGGGLSFFGILADLMMNGAFVSML